MSAIDRRTRAGNLVLNDLRSGPEGPIAELAVDRDHPFFFDHPLDHIPGLLLLEGAVQLAQSQAKTRCFVARIEAQFIRYALFDAPVSLRATVCGTRYRIRLEQSGKLRARIDVDLSELGPDPAKAEVRYHLPLAVACDQELLGKRRPENVLIATPECTADRIATTLLPPNPMCQLTDSAKALHPLHLLESFMQVQRFLNTRRNNPDRMRDILTGVRLSQIRPVTDKAAPVAMRGSTVFQPGGKNRLSRDARLSVDNQNFAQCSIETVLVGAVLQST